MGTPTLTAALPAQKQTLFSCDMSGMNDRERARHSVLVGELGKAVRSVKEVPNGYELRYKGARPIWPLASEWAGLESRCCPFLDLALTVSAGKDLVLVRLTGPKGVKPFLKMELGPLLKAR